MTLTMPPPVSAREPDPRHPLRRFASLFDEGTCDAAPDDGTGVRVARGRIDGLPVLGYCTDATTMGGALGADGAERIVAAIDLARDERLPVVGLWHSGGARLAEGVVSMDGVGRMFAAMTRASGTVPQVSVVLGPAAGAAAYGPALTDVVIMSRQARMFVTGPDVVRTVTGEEIDMEGLGGCDAHGRRSGVAHVTVDTEQQAMARARDVVGLLGRQGGFDAASVTDVGDLRALLPDTARRAYDVKPLVARILDGDPVELQADWAPNMMVALGRLGGRTVGVLANNPIRKGGCLDSRSAEKASRFVRMCDAFGVPMLVLVDVPGYLPGVGEEWGGVVRRGAKLLHAFAEAVVPRVTLITRKSYGGAYIAMNSRSLGATSVFAWPEAEIAVMGPEAAVKILHRRELAAAAEGRRPELLAELTREHERTAGGVGRALDAGVVDEVIDPCHTRRRLVAALAAAAQDRGAHGNIPL